MSAAFNQFMSNMGKRAAATARVPGSTSVNSSAGSSSGAIEAALSRPLAYVLARVAEEAGGTLLRLFLVGTLGVTIAWLATGIAHVAARQELREMMAGLALPEVEAAMPLFA